VFSSFSWLLKVLGDRALSSSVTDTRRKQFALELSRGLAINKGLCSVNVAKNKFGNEGAKCFAAAVAINVSTL
jgi:hypothetical protein